MPETDASRPLQVLSISPAMPPEPPASVSASSSPAAEIEVLPEVPVPAAVIAPLKPNTSLDDPDRSLGWVQLLLALGLGLVILAGVGCAVLLAVAHAHDRYGINIACGSWMALAWTANHGEIYPPLRDAAGHFAGTRYMPLYFLAHAAFARITGEYLFSGRIIAYASAALWTVLIALLARQRSGTRLRETSFSNACPWLFAGALATSVLLSPTGVQALCSIRSDGLALALQLAALWIVVRHANAQTSKRPNAETRGALDADPEAEFGHLGVSAFGRFSLRVAVLAGLLCALGFLAKLTAVWAAVAIGLWLLARDRRALLVFVISGLVLASAALLVLHAMTDGRMLDNFLGVHSIGWSGWGAVVFWSPRRMLEFISVWSPTTWVLVPPAVLCMLLAMARRDVGVLHLAWLACIVVLLVMFADIGVGENHILELAAMTAVLAGDLWGRTTEPQSQAAESARGEGRRRNWNIAQMILATAVVWSTQAAVKERLSPELQEAVTALRQRHPMPEDDPHALDRTLAGHTLLSDDPSVAVLMDQKPVVLDAFMFRGYEHSHPEWIDELAGRIARQEFDVIVLLEQANVATWWYYKLFLGAKVVRAIDEHYHLQREIGPYKVYARNGAQ